jgi:hypothetical protein
MALVWESRELLELHRAYREFLARKAHREAIKVAIMATISSTPPRYILLLLLFFLFFNFIQVY